MPRIDAPRRSMASRRLILLAATTCPPPLPAGVVPTASHSHLLLDLHTLYSGFGAVSRGRACKMFHEQQRQASNPSISCQVAANPQPSSSLPSTTPLFPSPPLHAPQERVAFSFEWNKVHWVYQKSLWGVAYTWHSEKCIKRYEDMAHAMPCFFTLLISSAKQGAKPSAAILLQCFSWPRVLWGVMS